MSGLITSKTVCSIQAFGRRAFMRMAKKDEKTRTLNKMSSSIENLNNPSPFAKGDTSSPTPPQFRVREVV
jgi:hypothetical protein